MKLLILDGNLRSTLATVRSLGRAGIEIGVGNDTPGMIAGRSAYCREMLVHPSPICEPGLFERFLAEEVTDHGYSHVLAMSDTTTLVCNGLKEKLESRIHLIAPEAIMLVQDKHAMVEIAQRLSIEVPQFVTGCSDDQLLKFAERVGYPVVIKPRRSRQCVNGVWKEGRVRYAFTPNELLKIYAECDREIAQPLVQERIDGEGRGVFLLMWNGEIMASFCHRRLREKPPWGGISVLCESIPADDSLVQRSASLLRCAGMNGPAMVEYKIDRRDGLPRLMEVNGRLWGSLHLAIESGVDFPWIYLQLIRGREVAPVLHSCAGVKSRWLLGDVDALLTRICATRRQEYLLSPSSSRISACIEFCRLWSRGLHYDVMSWSDPRPALEELRQYVASNSKIAVRRVASTLSRRG